MRIVVQRVKHAEVSVEGDRVGSIGKGALVFFGVHKEDSPSMIPWLAQKLIQLRIFSDEQDKMNLSLMDIGGEILVVSQFTLYAKAAGLIFLRRRLPIKPSLYMSSFYLN
jgi:D-aminoacyl-tRNA deacylase